MDAASDASEPESDLEAPLAEAPSGNCRRSCVVLTLLSLGLLAASILALRATWEGRVEAAVARVEAEGLQIRGLILPPKGGNGAQEILAAHGALSKSLPEDVFHLYGTGPADLAKALEDPTSIDAEIAYTKELPSSPAKLEDALAMFVKALDQVTPEIRAGLAKEVVWGVEFEEKGNATDFNIYPLSQLIGCLVIRAGDHMLQGRPEQAYDDIEICLALARTAPNQVLIGHLVRNVCLGQAVCALAELQELGPPPAQPQLTRILTALRAFEADFSLTTPLLGELYSAQLFTEAQFRAELPRDFKGPLGQLRTGEWRAAYVEGIAECLLASRQPPAQFNTYLEELHQRRNDHGPFFAMVATTYPRAFEKALQSQAEVRLVIRALELAARTEGLPESDVGMPLDPCLLDQVRCRYRLDADYALLWSVGRDREDQEGVTDAQSEGEADDIAFRIPRRKR